MRHADMNEENTSSNLKEPTVRITRARAKALVSAGELPPLCPSRKQDDKRFSRANLKRAASDNNKSAPCPAASPRPKKRAVLKDVTNVTCENLYLNCINATRNQHSRHGREGHLQKKAKPPCAEKSQISVDKRENAMKETNKVNIELSKEISSTENLKTETSEFITTKMLGEVSPDPKKINSNRNIRLLIPSTKEDHKLRKKEESLEDRGIIDIDLKHQDPQMCSIYAADIYSSWFATQLDRRPLVDYIEKLQGDITQGMRSILIDWLVQVSEEYKLTPDTLYLTINLMDRFLSENYIEKTKLQLLGVTCMLIASKYEEIFAPPVEEFCYITDNTYSKEEVVKMESHVLNLLNFQLSVPTTKKFLRRFIQVAQAFYKIPSVEMEFLANYLAELTLMEYSFLKFLPSLIAASAVFLARWTLDQSGHPWNSTLEHYTTYKTSELKSTVLELQDLQLNTDRSMINVIREKYKQSKFKCVSTLHALKPVQSLF